MDYKEILKINKQLKKPFLKLKFFEKGHIYKVKGDDRPIKSVSTHLKHFYEDFPSDIIAPKYAVSRGFEVQDVLDAWKGEGDIANTHGTRVHLVGEDYVKWKFFKQGKRPSVFCKQSLATLNFINDLPDYLIPVALELQMFSPEHYFSGTADGILLNTRTNKFIIYDFKSNKALEDSEKPYLKLIDRKHKLRQDNFGKYTLQLNLYQLLLEEAGFEVQGRIIVWLNEDKENKKLYRTYKAIDVREELTAFLKTKKHLEYLNN